jgi:hypothetical protein
MEFGFDRVYVNSQERHWSTANPKSIHQVPLCDVRVGVWCAMSTNRINEPVSFPSPYCPSVECCVLQFGEYPLCTYTYK